MNLNRCHGCLFKNKYKQHLTSNEELQIEKYAELNQNQVLNTCSSSSVVKIIKQNALVASLIRIILDIDNDIAPYGLYFYLLMC